MVVQLFYRKSEPFPAQFISSSLIDLLQGKFSTKSDVYSFAITLWEILTFAREQPFENLSDEKVVENFGHIYKDDKKHVSTHEIFHSVICLFIRFDKSVLELYVYSWMKRCFTNNTNNLLCHFNFNSIVFSLWWRLSKWYRSTHKSHQISLTNIMEFRN